MAKNQNKKKTGDDTTAAPETTFQATPEVTAEITTSETDETDDTTAAPETTSSSETEDHTDEGHETAEEKEIVDSPVDAVQPAKTAAEVFETKPLHETPPNPNKQIRVPGVKTPPAPSGGWHLFIDPVTSVKSVVTASAKKILLKEKTPLRYLGPCDEKGNLVTDGKA